MEAEAVSFFEQLVFWHWLVLGLGLIILEITLFGAFFILWPGAAAIIVGLLMLLIPDMSWHLQFVVWGILSIACVVVWYFYRKRNPVSSDEPLLNRRGEQYVGRTFTLEEDVVNGLGTVRVDDSRWKIEAQEDFSKGTQIKVVSVDGTILQVEKT